MAEDTRLAAQGGDEDARPNDGTRAVEEHPGAIAGPDEPPTYGERNRKLPQQLKDAIKQALVSMGRLELYDRRRETMRDFRNRKYRAGQQHMYGNRNTGAYTELSPGETVSVGGNTAPIQCPEYMGDFNIFRPTELVIESVLTQQPPGIDFRPDTQSTEDLEAADTAETYREYFDRSNDVKLIQLRIVQMMCESGRTVVAVSTEADAQLLGENGKGDAKQREVARVYGTLESKCVPLTARDQASLDAVFLYDDPSVNKAKGEYPHIRTKIKGGPAISENMYERILRLGVLQGNRRSGQLTDALSHLAGRVNAFLRPSCWEADYFDEPYELFAGDDEAGIPADELEDNENEDGTPFSLRDKLNQLFPQGMHTVYVGLEYAEAWAESVDDALAIGFPYEGDGMSREAMMDDAVEIQDFFNNIMNLLWEAVDTGWPRTHVNAEDDDFDALTDQISAPYMFSLHKARNGMKTQDDFFREPDLVLPDSVVKLMEYLGGPFLQFVLGTPPSLFGAGMEDQKTASGYATARAQAMGVKGVPWMAVQKLMARMYTMAALKAAQNPDYAEQILVPVANGQMKTMKLERLTKGHFGAYPDEDSSFPTSTAEQRAMLQQMITMAASNPEIASQLLGYVYNWEIFKQIFGMSELELPQAECAAKQMREIEELLQQSPIPPPPEQLAAWKQQQQAILTQHATAAAAAHLAGQPLPPAPPTPVMVTLGGGGDDGEGVEYPMELLKPSIEPDPQDFDAWEGLTGKQWLSSKACWRELNVGRPGPDGAVMPNPEGVANVRLHVQIHLDRAAAMMATAAPTISPAATGPMPPAPPGGKPGLPQPAGAGQTM